MAGANYNVFPLYIDADSVTLSADNNDYNVTTSRVILNGDSATVAIEVNDLGNNFDVGTVVEFDCIDASQAVTVKLKGAKEGTSSDTATFNEGDTAKAMYFEGGWRWVAHNGCVFS